jgi:pimeloyl-ACP methyl ester carboxylesterase
MPRALIGILAGAVLLSVGMTSADAQAVVADLPISGATERAAFWPAPQARATVILLAGGDGIVAIDESGNSRNNNFLVRTRGLWLQYGINAMVLGSPNGHSLFGQRHLPAYAAALGVAVDFARSRSNVPVWLVGTSMGSIAAANGAAHLGGKVAGVVLTSSVTKPNRFGEIVADSEPGLIAVPALVVSNSGDLCSSSRPGDAANLLASMPRSPRKEVIVVQSSQLQSDPCEALSPHGYLGIEADVVKRMAEWIVAAPGR